MPETISSLIAKFEGAQGKVKASIVEAFNSNSEKWVDYNRDQLTHGLTRLNKRIGIYRNTIYSEVKNRMNPLAGEGYVDLKYKGDFYKHMFAKVQVNSKILTGSSDIKYPKIEKKYGSDEIYGLNEENKKRFIFTDFYPTFINVLFKL